MNFFKTSILSGASTAISMVTSIVTNKLIAIFIGSEGFAIIGQFKDFLKLSLSIGQLGLDKGIIKYVSQYKNQESKLNVILSAAITAQIAVSIILGLLLFFFRNPIQNYLLGTTEYSHIFILSCFGILPIVLFTTTMSILNGLHEIKRYVVISIISNILSATCTILLIYFYRLTGVLMSLFLNQFISLGVAFILIRKSSIQLSWFSKGIQSAAIKKLFKFSLMFITGSISLSIVLIAVRKYLSMELGLEYAGYWEAMWRISTIYLSFLTSTFGLYLLPTFSKLKTKYLKKEVLKIWKITIPLTLLVSVSIYLLRDFAIELLYTEEFMAISSLFLFQLAGDVLKINSWILGNLIVAKAQVKVFISVQLGWALLFYFSVISLVPVFGFQGVSIAYLFTYLIHFTFMNIYFKKLLWRF